MPTNAVVSATDLGALIKRTRKSLKITQAELSLQTGISRPTIRSIEKGKETAHIGLVLQLCRDLGITLAAETTSDLI